MNHLETAIKRNTAKGRQAEIILEKAKDNELEKANKIFGRSAPTWADFEFIYPIISRTNVA